MFLRGQFVHGLPLPRTGYTDLLSAIQFALEPCRDADSTADVALPRCFVIVLINLRLVLLLEKLEQQPKKIKMSRMSQTSYHSSYRESFQSSKLSS